MGKEDAQPHEADLGQTGAGPRPITPLTLFPIIIGSVLGTGFIPIAPATFASLLTLALIWILPKSLLTYSAVTAVAFLLAVWLASWFERRWGHDARQITIDELVGMLITFLLVPFSLLSAIVGLLLFRFFDIVKLPFVRRFERLPGGWGVVMDNVAAGVCANAVLQLVFRLVWPVRAVPWSMPS